MAKRWGILLASDSLVSSYRNENRKPRKKSSKAYHIFQIMRATVFKIFGYRMDGRDKPVTELNLFFLCLFKVLKNFSYP